MEFYEITEELKVSPGEYVLHSPSNTVVLCGSFSRSRDKIRVLGNAGMFEDEISNFKKIKVEKESRPPARRTRCKGCSRGRY